MKVIDLSIEELKALLKEAVEEKFAELFSDPDSGLALREEVELRLKTSLASKERIPLDEVKRKLGLNEL